MNERLVNVFDSNREPTKLMIDTSNHFMKRIKEMSADINLYVLDSREKAIVQTKLEEMAMFLNKAIFHYKSGGQCLAELPKQSEGI